MTIALPLIPESEKKTARRQYGCLEVTTNEKRIKLPLASVDLRARVADRMAHVTVTETFQNPFKEHLEAVYIFPLSGGCAVSSFQMKVGDRLIEGKVEERQAAREQYAQAMQEGKRVALLEQEREDVFTVQVGNLPPGEEITVILSYSEKLPYFDQGLTEIRLPLVVAPRYIPGTPLERDSVGDGVELDTNLVPDASRITPPRLAPGVDARVGVGISVELTDLETIEDLSCSQHATRMGAGKEGFTVSLARVDELLDRDFVLRWRVAGESVQSKFFIYQGTAGSGDASSKKSNTLAGAGSLTDEEANAKAASAKTQGPAQQTGQKQGGKSSAAKGSDAEGKATREYFGMISLTPPMEDEIVKPARDVIFVFDRSGSMAGVKIVSAARACSFLLATLGPNDRFAIQAFDNTTQWMQAPGGGYFLDADEAGLESGYKYLRGIAPAGGTELQGAVQEAIKVMDANRSNSTRMPVIVILTDGEVGNESAIIKYLQDKLGDNRVFTVGIDTAVNDGFLRKLATIGGGTSTFVEPGAQLERALAHVGREIGTPLITDLEIEDINCGLDKDSIAPASLPDLFEGRAINAFFRLTPGSLKDLSTAKIRVKGLYANGKPFSTEIDATTTDVQSLPQLWAKTVVVDLEDKYRVSSGLEQEKLKNQIISVAVAHSLLTRFTAFVVVDHAEIVNKDGVVRKMVQPVQQPASWEDQQVQTGSWGAAGSIGSAMRYGAAPRQMHQAAPSAPMMGAGFGANLTDQIRAKLKSSSNQSDFGSPPSSPAADAWGAPAPSNQHVPPPAPPPASRPQPQQAPQSPPPPKAPVSKASPPAKSAESIVRKFQEMSDSAIDKIFNNNLGLSAQETQQMPQAAGGWMPFNASPPTEKDTLSKASALSAGAEQEMKALEKTFDEFEKALNQVLESLKKAEMPQSAQLELARGALLSTLAKSAVAVKLPQLQKYLRADVLHLIAALSSASSVSKKLKEMAADHERIFAEVWQEVTVQIKEENKPFWGLMV
jgi:Ca-activated chloride channel family protein